MRKILLIFLLGLIFIFPQNQAGAAMIHYEKWEKVLKTYVNDNGMVNYDGLKADRAVLDDFITNQVENADIEALSKDGRKAFWINAYNALTMRLIVDHYPLRFGGIRTIHWGHPWDIKMKAAGRTITLMDIEHKILRKWDPMDPRIHSAINCASIGCPKLMGTHFDPEKLDEQLDAQMRRFVDDPQKVRLDRTAKMLYHSAIFNWFKEDFLTVSPDLITFIAQYLNANDKNYLLTHKSDIQLKELKYDWGLNKQ